MIDRTREDELQDARIGGLTQAVKDDKAEQATERARLSALESAERAKHVAPVERSHDDRLSDLGELLPLREFVQAIKNHFMHSRTTQ